MPIDELVWNSVYELLIDEKIPIEKRQSIWFHITKPWIVNHRVTIISPTSEAVDKKFLYRQLVLPTRTHTKNWFIPSSFFWNTHIDVSHNSKLDCLIQPHVDFLSNEGKNYEFDYAIYTWDGKIEILDARDFIEECKFFDRFKTVNRTTEK